MVKINKISLFCSNNTYYKRIVDNKLLLSFFGNGSLIISRIEWGCVDKYNVITGNIHFIDRMLDRMLDGSFYRLESPYNIYLEKFK